MRFIVGTPKDVGIGTAFGATASLVSDVPSLLGEVGQAHSQDSPTTWAAIFVGVILNTGCAWAALAFTVGWFITTQARPVKAYWGGAIAGVAALLTATAAYYLTDLLLGVDMNWQAAAFWSVRAIAFGAPLGVAGVIARRGGWLGLIAAFTVPVGAMANMVILPIHRGLTGESSADGWAQLGVWIAALAGSTLVIIRFARSRPARVSPAALHEDVASR